MIYIFSLKTKQIDRSHKLVEKYIGPFLTKNRISWLYTVKVFFFLNFAWIIIKRFFAKFIVMNYSEFSKTFIDSTSTGSLLIMD